MTAAAHVLEKMYASQTLFSVLESDTTSISA